METKHSKAISPVMVDPVVRMKRRIRDHFNKNVNDIETLTQIGKIMGLTAKFFDKEDEKLDAFYREIGITITHPKRR